MKKKVSFLKTINKEWKIDFNDEKFHPLSWKQLIKQAGVKDGINDQVYNLLSWHAHTQSISVLQLQDMWNKEFDKDSLRIAVNKLNMFIAFMISDIIKVDKDYVEPYEKLDNDLKGIIDFYNLSFRGSDFTI